MPNDPKLDAWRQQYVLEYQRREAEAKLIRETNLQKAKERVLLFLTGSRIDSLIRKILYGLDIDFSATKFENGQIPLDGQIGTNYTPVFTVDKLGQIALHHQAVPGFRYEFHLGLNEVILFVTICEGRQGGIFPLFSLSHRDGRTHLVDSNTSMVNPGNDRLNRWLIGQITRFIENSQVDKIQTGSLYMVGDCHISSKNSPFTK
jgi:hypothetical protein